MNAQISQLAFESRQIFLGCFLKSYSKKKKRNNKQTIKQTDLRIVIVEKKHTISRMCKAKLFFQQCCICLFNSPLPYEFYCIRLFYLLQTAVQLQNDLSVLYLFLRQNCFFAVLFFSIRHCFLLILSLLLRYSDTSKSSELI